MNIINILYSLFIIINNLKNNHIYNKIIINYIILILNKFIVVLINNKYYMFKIFELLDNNNVQ